MESFDLSLSPYFNDVIRNAQLCYNEPQQTVYRHDLADSLKNMVKFSELLTKSFAQAMQVRPKTALSKQAPDRFEKALRHLSESLRTINQFFKDDNAEHLLSGIGMGRQALEEMFAIFEDMRVEEESFPVFSKSPYIQELVRVATGVAKGEYTPDVLQGKLNWMRERQKEFSQEFANLKSSPHENEEVDKLLPIAEKALTKMGLALDEMYIFFRDKRKEHLKEGCAVLLQSSEVLVAVQERLLKASTAQPAACPKCGQMNKGGAKICQACGATLPELVGISHQTVEYKENDPQRPTYTYLARIEGAIDSHLAGMLDKEELKKHIDFFAGKAKEGRQSFEALKVPDKWNSPEEEEKSLKSYKAMDQGTKLILEGVKSLQKYLSTDERDCLSQGMEKVYEGARVITGS